MRTTRWILCLVTCAWWVDSARATVLLPADFETVVHESSVIVHGRVVDVRSALTGPQRAIESVVTVAVIDSLKGDPGPTVAFRVPNGQVGRYRRILVGAPEFAEGDEIVAFLRGRAPALPTIFGLSQGLYRVSHDAAARPLVMPPPASGVGAGVARLVRGDPTRRPMPLEAFAREVHAVLGRSR